MKKFPVWLDCDVGVDDAIAIMTAHALSEIDLLAISTVSGNAPLSATFPNAHRMNGLMKTHYPVYKGADRPLLVEPQYAAAFHGENGLGDVELPLPEDAVMNVPPLGTRCMPARSSTRASSGSLPSGLLQTSPLRSQNTRSLRRCFTPFLSWAARQSAAT